MPEKTAKWEASANEISTAKHPLGPVISALQHPMGADLVAIVLFGSRARGDHQPVSEAPAGGGENSLVSAVR